VRVCLDGLPRGGGGVGVGGGGIEPVKRLSGSTAEALDEPSVDRSFFFSYAVWGSLSNSNKARVSRMFDNSIPCFVTINDQRQVVAQAERTRFRISQFETQIFENETGFGARSAVLITF
jgi:hypothetical protein